MLAQIAINTPGTYNDYTTVVGSLITRLFQVGIILAGLYFFVRLVISGFTFLTGMGEPAKIQAAQAEILHAALGLIIVLSVFFVGQIINAIFGLSLPLVWPPIS